MRRLTTLTLTLTTLTTLTAPQVELSEYKKHRDKEARSLISLFRELDASMLKKKDRGREGAIGQRTIAEYDVVGDRILTESDEWETDDNSDADHDVM